MNNKISKTDNEWQNELSAEEYSICRKKNTEAPFTGIYWDCKDNGIYKCTCCGLELFSSETKFDSGTGWPSFSQILNNDNIEFVKDTSHGIFKFIDAIIGSNPNYSRRIWFGKNSNARKTY